MPVTTSIHQFLQEGHVPYTVVPHRPAYSAQADAAAVHVPGREWAKVVVCIMDGRPIEAVVPAPLAVNLADLVDLAGGMMIRLATEEELGRLFADCEPGAMPPLGPVYGQKVFVDVALAGEPEILFDAGNHTEAIAMRWADFVKLVRPIVGRFAASM